MSLAPFILVGCGGSGVLSVRHVRDEVRARLRQHGIEKIPAAWQFIGIDVLPTMSELGEASPLPPLDYLQLRVGARNLVEVEEILLAANPPAQRGGYTELLGWRPSAEELSAVDPIAGMTNRGVGRFVGASALQSATIRNRIEAAFTACEGGGAELAAVAQEMGLPIGNAETPATNVIVITSMAGGCGAGISLDVIDLLRKWGGSAVQPTLIAYGADIFGPANRKDYWTANNLAYLSELLNAMWSDDGGKNLLFPASRTRPIKRGPRAAFILGRKNLRGFDFQDSRTVYRAAGVTIAGIILNPTVLTRFSEHILGNWSIRPRGGYGFADSAIFGEVSSFGSATIAVGRKRFRDYARRYLLRDLYEHHFRGYKKVALSLFGEDGAQATDVAIKARLVTKFLPEVIEAYGLNNPFGEKGAILDDGSAQVSDQLLSARHISGFASEVSESILSRLPNESLSGSEWSELVAAELAVEKRRLLFEATSSFHAREEDWLNGIAGQNGLVHKVMSVSNDYLTRLSLPVMIDLTQGVIEAVNRTAGQFKNSATEAVTKSKLFAEDSRNEFADVSSNKLSKTSPQIQSAVEYLAASVGQELKAQISNSIAQTLEQVVINLLGPLNSAFRRSKDDVFRMADVTTAGEAPVIHQWPVDSVVPRAFIPSSIEHLLEGHEEWPKTIDRLLRRAETVGVGESTIDAVRRGISDGVVTGSTIGPNDLRPLLWTRNDAPVHFARTAPLAINLGLDLETLEARVDRWLGKPGRELGDFLREGLGEYLRDENHPDHNQRMRKFEERLRMALEQANPFVETDSVYFGTTYPGNAAPPLTYLVEPIPFPDGHKAHELTREMLLTKVGDAGPTLKFEPQDREGITVSTFFERPMFPGIFSSIMREIAEVGGRYVNRGSSELRAWLDFKRARTLDETIPLPVNVTRALIRGFVIGRLTGLLKVPASSSAPFEISSEEEILTFPHPAYGSISNELVSILMSFPLCFINVSRDRDKAFAAYASLFRLGMSDADGALSPLRFSIAGEFESFLRTGRTTRKQIDTPRAAGNSPEERKASAITYVTDFVTWLEGIDAKPLTGEERVRLQVTWDDDTVPIKEIAKLLIEEYNNVLRVLSGKGDVSQPKT